jgi:hypothetical protein
MIPRLRTTLAALAAAAVLAGGCVLVSGQFVVQYTLGDVTVNSVSNVNGQYVDLTGNSTYNDHKDDIKSLEDIALIGSIHNTGVASSTISVYLVDGNPGAIPASQVITSGTQVWGPLTVAAGATETLDWKSSTKLFGAGKATLLAHIKSGTNFSLYALSNNSPYSFDITNAVFIAVIGAGK